ncbi:putative ATP synthase subunit [Babesia sp. Xinjiang]|uniref:putative ATP synthase subunit n=1 Tax=Babesia sp. Xinjiang TaxID=462227 RepID=UPI000A2664BF|nr:putative ATP synthase subunit [Babesia sp. Xinjiang]ORM42001.1 putative ATP synthase subunit [Babesia sp. Xinjiang]
MRAHIIGRTALRVRDRIVGGLQPINGALRISQRNVSNAADTNALEMMDCNGVMGSYAKALYLAAKEAQNVETVMRDLNNLQEAMAISEEFKIFVSSPCLRSTTKVDFLRDDIKALGMPSLQKQTLLCLEILFEQRRSGDLPTLAKLFETLYMATKGQVKCFVHSAADLSAKHKGALENALKKRLGSSSQPAVVYNVNPNLMGGLLVRIGDQVIDASVTAKLDRMHSQLSHAT